MAKHLQLELAIQRLALATVLIVCFCSVLHVKQAWPENIVYLDISFDFDEGDPENAELEKLLELSTTPRPIIGFNQTIRGNAPGVIKVTLSDTDNVIEILWPGFNEVPLYSLILNIDTFTQQSVEVIASSLYFGTQAKPEMKMADPVIVVEPNKKFEAPILKYSDSFYGILLPLDAVVALLSYIDYEHEFSEPYDFKTIKYGKWTFTEWNDSPHVTIGPDQVFVSYVNRDPSEGSFNPLWTSDFTTTVFARYPTEPHEPRLSWTLKTKPPGANILLTGKLITEQTITAKELTNSEVKSTVFQMTNFVQCPYDDADKDWPKPGEAILSCDLVPEPPGKAKATAP